MSLRWALPRRERASECDDRGMQVGRSGIMSDETQENVFSLIMVILLVIVIIART